MQGRGKQQIAERIDDATVHLFRPRAFQVVGAEAGLDVGHGYPAPKRGHCTAHGTGGVALNDDPVRSQGAQHRIHARHHASDKLIQVLIGPHQPQVMVGGEAEEGEDGFDQIAVLSSNTDDGLDVRSSGKCQDHRRQLDRLRSRPDHRENFQRTGLCCSNSLNA